MSLTEQAIVQPSPYSTAPSRRPQTWIRVVVLTALFTAAACFEARNLNSLSSVEVWIHLRTGNWMLENHAIPRTGLFSQYSNLSWQDSTWAFDLWLGILSHAFGLRAVAVNAMLLKVGLALATFLAARGGRNGFFESVTLSALAQYAIAGVQPLPYLCSIIFLAIELRLLLTSRRVEKSNSLMWLPPLFVVWVNVHSQFVLGLALLVLFAISEIVERTLRNWGVRWISGRIVHGDTRAMATAIVLSFAATLVNPYAYRLFPTALRTTYSHVSFKYFAEMHALSFRRPQDYVLLLLVMTAFLSLGRLRSLELFELASLVCATGIALRIGRENWLAVLFAIALFSSGISWLPRGAGWNAPALRLTAWAWTAAVSAIVIVAAISSLPRHAGMVNRLSKVMPVGACDYIRSHQLPNPVFNTYSFGSFLTWYLPEYPVVIDSRLELYGNSKTDEYFQAVSGNRRIEDAPILAQAKTLLLERESGLGMALTTFPVLEERYRQVYSDDIARVFVALPPPTPDPGP